MKTALKIEELAMMLLGLYLTWQLDTHPNGWQYLLLFFTPDIGMLGYFINPKWGAIGYNLLHNKSISILLWGIGILSGMNTLQFIGLLLFTHISFDRIFGFGLKYYTDFKHTHLGKLG